MATHINRDFACITNRSIAAPTPTRFLAFEPADKNEGGRKQKRVGDKKKVMVVERERNCPP